MIYLEFFFIAILVIIQIVLFSKNYQNIKESRVSIPFPGQFRIKHVCLSQAVFKEKSLAGLIEFCKDFPDIPAQSRGGVKQQLVYCKVSNDTIDQILYSINTYLIKNKGAAADFNLIKDIVERHTDARGSGHKYFFAPAPLLRADYELNKSVAAALQKGDKIEDLTNGVSELVRDESEQQKFLKRHFSDLDERKNVITRAVAGVDDTLDKSLKDLSKVGTGKNGRISTTYCSMG